MITYKGDIFVKGKKFILEEQVLTFQTKSKKGFVFNTEDGKTKVLEESVARSLKEVRYAKK